MRTTIVVSVAVAAVVGLTLFDAAPAAAAKGGRFVASKVPSRSMQPRMHKPMIRSTTRSTFVKKGTVHNFKKGTATSYVKKTTIGSG